MKNNPCIDDSLPDGTPGAAWRDKTDYLRTYHVSAMHPDASDSGPGTEETPFRTIGRAAAEVRPGERVLVHAGVYREEVCPTRGGEGPDRMIAYESAPGEVAIIKGSRVLPPRWQGSRDAQGNGFSIKLWMLDLRDALGETPLAFCTPNTSDAELDLMPWAVRWKGRIPYCLPRGLLFEGGRRMVQLATYEDLVRVPGSYWVAPGGSVVHIHPFAPGDPNGRLFEAAVQSHLFCPHQPGLGYIRVSGLIFEQCANGLPRVGVGALNAWGGHHWIIADNTVREVNSVGIEFGYRTHEYEDPTGPRRDDPDLGHHQVLRNRVHGCGTAGMRSFVVSHARVTDNCVYDCGWQNAEYHWEVAGMKLLICTNTLVAGNHISRIEDGCGIWLDWDNRNCRVTRNLIHDVHSISSAIFVEASRELNHVDHNIAWNIDNEGVRLADSDNTLVAHNLFGRVHGDPVHCSAATDRSVRGRRVTSTCNSVINNLFYACDRPLGFVEPGNRAAGNLYVDPAASQVAGCGPLTDESGSSRIAGMLLFDDQNLTLEWTPAAPPAGVPPLDGFPRDYFGQPRNGKSAVPGPFHAFAAGSTLRVAPVSKADAPCMGHCGYSQGRQETGM